MSRLLARVALAALFPVRWFAWCSQCERPQSETCVACGDES